jgi:hypothetical protein
LQAKRIPAISSFKIYKHNRVFVISTIETKTTHIFELAFSHAIAENDDTAWTRRLLGIVFGIKINHALAVFNQPFLDLLIEMASNDRFTTM